MSCTQHEQQAQTIVGWRRHLFDTGVCLRPRSMPPRIQLSNSKVHYHGTIKCTMVYSGISINRTATTKYFAPADWPHSTVLERRNHSALASYTIQSCFNSPEGCMENSDHHSSSVSQPPNAVATVQTQHAINAYQAKIVPP